MGIKYYTSDISDINPIKITSSYTLCNLDSEYSVEINECYINKSNLFNEGDIFNNKIVKGLPGLTPDYLNQNTPEKNMSYFIGFNYNKIDDSGVYWGKDLTSYMTPSYFVNDTSYNYIFKIYNKEFYKDDYTSIEKINLGLYYNYADISYMTNIDSKTISYYKYNCMYDGDLTLYSPYDYGIGHKKSNGGITINRSNEIFSTSYTSYLAYIIKYDFWDDQNCYNVGIIQDINNENYPQEIKLDRDVAKSNAYNETAYIRYKSIDLLPITLYENNNYIISNLNDADCISYLNDICISTCI